MHMHVDNLHVESLHTRARNDDNDDDNDDMLLGWAFQHQQKLYTNT